MQQMAGDKAVFDALMDEIDQQEAGDMPGEDESEWMG